MKVYNYKNLLECHKNVIYPIYEEDIICENVKNVLGDCDDFIKKSLNEITIIYTFKKYNFETITFIGLGSKKTITTEKLRKAFLNVSKKIKKESVFLANTAITDKIDIHKITELFIESYVYASYKERIIGHDEQEFIDVDIIAFEDVSEDIKIGYSYGSGINYARKLADTPANLMTPYIMVEEAIALAKQYNMEYTILDKNSLEEMGAGGILSVNQGSHIPAYMIILKYTNSDTPYNAIVGKGLTFDSGGYNLKSNCYGMKYDMCGGANVLAIMKILASTKAKVNVYGIIPTTENLISSKAYRPQDVITTLSKKTVEIVSTDAEGRLILCDALTYAQSLGADSIIDMATLTGACVNALGNVYTGVFSNNDEYYYKFMDAMMKSDEKGWRLPLDDEYFKMLESKSADFKNSAGKPGGGASQAACFLKQFINEETKWIHLDIAGTANNDIGATGAMIRSVVNMLKG